MLPFTVLSWSPTSLPDTLQTLAKGLQNSLQAWLFRQRGESPLLRDVFRPLFAHHDRSRCVPIGYMLAGMTDSIDVIVPRGGSSRVARVLQRRGLPWDAVIDPAAQVSRAHGMSAVPGFLVVDRQGKVRTPTVGYTTEWGMRLRLWWVDITD